MTDRVARTAGTIAMHSAVMRRVVLAGCGAIAISLVPCHPALAQAESLPSEAQLDERWVVEACAAGTVTTNLPNPFVDLSPTDWAYEAVLTMVYCGPYRGAIPPEQWLEFRESQRSRGQSSSNNG